MTELEYTATSQHQVKPTAQSTKTLLKASAYALLLAMVMLTVVILPAEYGIDPTGLGAKLGLTTLANTEDIVDQSPPVSASPDTEIKASDYRTDTVDIAVPAGKGLEYKFDIAKGKALRYAWATKGGELFFDFHGEPKGDTTGYFESYTVSTASAVRGSFTASFDGSHGWYWKNNGSQPIVVTLMTEGDYEILGIK